MILYNVDIYRFTIYIFITGLHTKYLTEKKLKKYDDVKLDIWVLHLIEYLDELLDD